jgi:hypothetical protein
MRSRLRIGHLLVRYGCWSELLKMKRPQIRVAELRPPRGWCQGRPGTILMLAHNPPIPIKFCFRGTLGSPFHISQMHLHQATEMVKESKFFRKQAEKAERMARAVSDAEISQSFMNMAKAYRSQADMLKTKKPTAKKKSGKKRR